MNQRANYQPTSNPYAADLLNVHDDKLKFALEFGTQNTINTGDAFTSDPGATPTQNSINARMAMLEVVSEDNISQPRGTTFLIPPWSEYTENPIFGDARVQCLYAHILLRDAPVGSSSQALVGLVVAPETLVGAAPAVPLALLGPNPSGGGMEGQEAEFVTANFATGGGGMPSSTTTPHWGTNLYIRLFMLGDDDKETEISIFASRDGLSYTSIGDIEVDTVRRVGLGVVGPANAWLDWVRIYDYPVTSLAPTGFLLPFAPLTGDRRF